VTIQVTRSGTVELRGECPVEDAEQLLQRLVDDPDATVDWSGCESAHSAVIQVLLVARITVAGTPASAFLRDKVAPLLRTSG